MSLRTIQRLTLMSVLALGAVAATGCDDDNGGTKTAADAGGNTGGNTGNNTGNNVGQEEGGLSEAGMEGPMCGTPAMTCKDAPKLLGAVPLPACCATLDGAEVCGIDGTMIPGLDPLHGCQPANLPGSNKAAVCDMVLAKANHPDDPKNPGKTLPGISPTTGVFLNLVGCCTMEGGCGVQTNAIKNIDKDNKEIGTLSLGMGCVPFAKFAALVPAGAPFNPFTAKWSCEVDAGM